MLQQSMKGSLRRRVVQVRNLLLGPAHLSEDTLSQLRAAQISALVRMTPFMMLANLTAMCVVVAVFWRTGHDSFLVVWSALFSLFMIAGTAQWLLSRTRPVPQRASRRAVTRVIASCLLPAIAWGAIPIALFPSADSGGQLLIASLVLGTLSAGAYGLATLPLSAFLYTGTIALSAFVTLAGADDGVIVTIAVLLLVYVAITWYAVGWFATLFASNRLHALELEEQKELIGLLLNDFQENASDWLFEVNADGAITTISNRLLETIGVPESQIIGKPFLKVLAVGNITKGAPEWDRIAAVFENREPFSSVEIPVTINGTLYWWSLTGKPIFDHKGRFTGYRGVGSNVTAERQARDRIVHMAHHDALTGLPNRVRLHQTLQEAVARRAPFAVLYIDLDNFKAINDTLGHTTGDAILVEVARRLRHHLDGQGLAVRLGGDEFAVVLHPISDPERAEALASDLVAAMAEPFRYRDKPLHLGASIGVAIGPGGGDGMTDVLRHADMALYAAKSAGRGTYRLFAQAMEDALISRRALEDDLRTAIAGNLLHIAYQPIMDIATGRMTGAEALLRWNHPTRGPVSPSEFIPIAEETGLIIPLGEWVLREACREAARWPEGMTIAVNVSAAQIHSPRLGAAIVSALEESRLHPRQLEIEITESVLADEAAAARMITAVHALGVRLSLDDFGTGYSSMAYLSRFSFDKIKIDQSFVRQAIERPVCAAIVDAVSGLARNLSMSTVAEGIETEAELAVVRAAGCTQGQGYHFGRPMTPEALRAVIMDTVGDMAPVTRAA